jgi:chaperonin GroEL (HSP60 family)
MLDAGYSVRMLTSALSLAAMDATVLLRSMAEVQSDSGRNSLISLARGAIGTKIAGQWSVVLSQLAVDAVLAMTERSDADTYVPLILHSVIHCLTTS